MLSIDRFNNARRFGSLIMETEATKLIATLGPATNTQEHLEKMKGRGVDFVRINLSHSSLDDLSFFIALAKKVGIPFMLDTEGSQIRTGNLDTASISLEEGEQIKLHDQPTEGNKQGIALRPAGTVSQLVPGDLLYIDFDSVILRVSDTSTLKSGGYSMATVVAGGTLGRNKAVALDTAFGKHFILPALSEKDLSAIEIGLREGVECIAASFMRSARFVDEVRSATQGKMKIVSKIECTDALEHLDEIIRSSDYLLIDRGDLSKEIPIEKIPLVQKMVISAAHAHDTPVFVATNLLESMVKNRRPTRAEVHDVIATILDGAAGLTLSAETAIGAHPIECVNMMNRLRAQASLVQHQQHYRKATDDAAKDLQTANYLLSDDSSTTLIKPHGGFLVDRILRDEPDMEYVRSLPKVALDEERQMDVEQIAVGTFSPIEGFMGENDFQSVLDSMRLASGEVWTIPIILDVPKETAAALEPGSDVALWDDEGPMAILHLKEKYIHQAAATNQKLYGTENEEHPGVRWINSLHPILLGGEIDLIRRRKSDYKEYELTPRQARRMFEERGWTTVVGFHTRNVIHRSHEFIQLEAMKRTHCDGLFVHPVIGKKKPGDFNAKYIIGAYEQMIRNFYPRDKVLFATYATFSRYAGPREAIFTALCRKNFGCTHFIVGRDHTGVGNFYDPKAAHEIFSQFDDLGIEPVFFDKVFYSKKLGYHVHEGDHQEHDEADKMHISGTEARKLFEASTQPPEWFMRPEISTAIIQAIRNKESVFVSK